MKAVLSAATVEYGLYEGRFWLPRLQTFEGHAQVGFIHVPVAMQHSFRYASVNNSASLAQIDVADAALDRDSLSAPQRRQRMDSVQKARRRQCDTSSSMVQRHTAARDPHGTHESLRVAYQVPCDMSTLAVAPELPNSIFDANEEIFGSRERHELTERALGMTAQPVWAPQRHVVQWGLELTRYNRIEGLSSGIAVDQQLGAGYVWRAVGRLGTGDVEPNAELTLARTNLSRTVGVTGYNRLVSANDWGNPLSFGSSLSALLFGRDEGFYYRAAGIELAGAPDASFGSRGRVTWRLFAEQERPAAVSTTFSLGMPWQPNVDARRDTYFGGAVRLDHSYGLDPRGLRLLSGLRLEAASSGENTRVPPPSSRCRRASAATCSARSPSLPAPPRAICRRSAGGFLAALARFAASVPTPPSAAKRTG
jgi:hypothetical protein